MRPQGACGGEPGEARVPGAPQDLLSCFVSEAKQKSQKVYSSCKESEHLGF